MSETETATVHRSSGSKSMRWGGRFLTTLVVLFLLVDGLAKVVMLEPVKEACVQLEIPERVVPGLGLVMTGATLLYAVPATSMLGAILMTGYLGGAIWTHVRLGDSTFAIIFPGLVAAMIWGGLFLRDPRVRALLPLRRSPALNRTHPEVVG